MLPSLSSLLFLLVALPLSSDYGRCRHHSRSLVAKAEQVDSVIPVSLVRSIDGLAVGPDESTVYAAEAFLFGGIIAVDIDTRKVRRIVRQILPFPFTSNWGLWYDSNYNVIVAVGSLKRLRVYDASTGRRLVECSSRSVGVGFVNDVAVIGDAAYVTDFTRNRPQLWVVRLDAAVNDGICDDSVITLNVDDFLDTGTTLLSSNNVRIDGIAPYKDLGFVLSNYGIGGGLYFYNLAEDTITQIADSDTTGILDGLDGVALSPDDNMMYVTKMSANAIDVYQLEEDDKPLTIRATKLGSMLQTGLLQCPVSNVVQGDRLVVVSECQAIPGLVVLDRFEFA